MLHGTHEFNKGSIQSIRTINGHRRDTSRTFSTFMRHYMLLRTIPRVPYEQVSCSGVMDHQEHRVNLPQSRSIASSQSYHR